MEAQGSMFEFSPAGSKLIQYFSITYINNALTAAQLLPILILLAP